MEPRLADHAYAFLTQPQARPGLLAALGELAHFFEETKLFIQNALNRGAVEQAEQAQQWAWAVAEHTAEPEHQALAHWCSLLFYVNRHVQQALHHALAAQHYYAASQQPEKEGRILIGIGSQLNLLGRFDEAEQAMSRAIALLQAMPDYRDWPMIYINLAYIQICQGRYREAVNTAARAASMAVDFGEQRPNQASRYQQMQASALINQGYAALFLGDFALARATLSTAQQLAAAQDFHEFVGRAALNLARLATLQGELFTALQLLRTARERFQRAQFELEIATVAIEEALLYERLAMPQPARRAALQAATAFAQANLPTECVEAYLIAVRLALARNEPQKANLYLGAAQPWLTTAQAVQQWLWRAYQAHPLFQRAQDQAQPALAAVEQAVAQLLQLGALAEALQADLIATQLAEQVASPTIAQRLATVIATAHRVGLAAVEQEACIRLAQHQTPALAVQTLQRAAALLAQTRRQMPVEELKANVITGHATVYNHLIKAQLYCRRYADALQTLLEAKGGIWADLAGPAQPLATTPNLNSARLALTFWRDELRTADSPDYRRKCQKKIDDLEQMIAAAARQAPQLRTAQPLPTLGAIQQCLPAETTALEYHVSAKLWVALVTGHAPPRWFCLGNTSAVRALLERLNLLLANLQHCQAAERLHNAQRQHHWVEQLLQQLFNVLVAPLAPYLPTRGALLIAPDDCLWQTPWSALSNGQCYLREQYTLTLVPSLALPVLSAQLAQSRPASKTLSPLALGYAGQPPLTYVAAELAAIQKIYPDLTVALPAVAADLSQHLPGEFLHIAAHARINAQSPLLSALELADGPFWLADVLRLNLQDTRLVTLSACETGVPPEQGGMLLALVGAFLCAGAQHVLATLWPVDDEATQLLMSHLYGQLANGASPPQALQQAQQVMQQTPYAHPFYWAAFQPFARAF